MFYILNTVVLGIGLILTMVEFKNVNLFLIVFYAMLWLVLGRIYFGPELLKKSLNNETINLKVLISFIVGLLILTIFSNTILRNFVLPAQLLISMGLLSLVGVISGLKYYRICKNLDGMFRNRIVVIYLVSFILPIIFYDIHLLINKKIKSL